MEIYMLGFILAFIITLGYEIADKIKTKKDIYVYDTFKCICISILSWGLVLMFIWAVIYGIIVMIGKLPIWRWKK